MNERVDSDAIAREGSDATPWSSGVGARRVTVRTPGLRLGLLLFAAGLLWHGILLTEPESKYAAGEPSPPSGSLTGCPPN